MNEPVSIDLQGYADQVARQRNAAMDENAQLRVLVDQVMAERDDLTAEVERLRGGGTPDA